MDEVFYFDFSDEDRLTTYYGNRMVGSGSLVASLCAAQIATRPAAIVSWFIVGFVARMKGP